MGAGTLSASLSYLLYLKGQALSNVCGHMGEQPVQRVSGGHRHGQQPKRHGPGQDVWAGRAHGGNGLDCPSEQFEF